MRRWVMRGCGGTLPRPVLEAVGDLGIAAHAGLVTRLLCNRDVRDGHAAEAFLRPTLARGLRAPLLLKDMARRNDGRSIPAIGFGLGHLPVRAGQRLDVVFTPRLSQWQGQERLELEVIDLRGASSPGVTQPAENMDDFDVP